MSTSAAPWRAGWPGLVPPKAAPTRPGHTASCHGFSPQFSDGTGVSELHRVFHLPGSPEHLPPAEPDDGGEARPPQPPAPAAPAALSRAAAFLAPFTVLRVCRGAAARFGRRFSRSPLHVTPPASAPTPPGPQASPAVQAAGWAGHVQASGGRSGRVDLRVFSHAWISGAQRPGRLQFLGTGYCRSTKRCKRQRPEGHLRREKRGPQADARDREGPGSAVHAAGGTLGAGGPRLNGNAGQGVPPEP